MALEEFLFAFSMLRTLTEPYLGDAFNYYRNLLRNSAYVIIYCRPSRQLWIHCLLLAVLP